MIAGYSGKPLVKKLGIKENYKVRILNPPENYFQILGRIPPGVEILKDASQLANFIHLFVIRNEK